VNGILGRTCSASKAVRVLSWWQNSGWPRLDSLDLPRRDSRRSCMGGQAACSDARAAQEVAPAYSTLIMSHRCAARFTNAVPSTHARQPP
jgi:hypothetical protein